MAQQSKSVSFKTKIVSGGGNTAGIIIPEKKVEELSAQVGKLQDTQAVRDLQFKYGYYLDKCLYDEVVDLFFREGPKVRLQPANATMAPIMVAANAVEIQGRVIGVLRKY